MVNLSSFTVSHYPDGHKHIVSDKDLHGDTMLVASIRSFDDLFLVAQVRQIHPELTTLRINYLLAARCDRRFSPGEAIDLKIVCDYIKSLGFTQINILKPHSSKTLEYMRAYNINYVCELDETKHLIKMCETDLKGQGNICYISPDHGASTWISEYGLKPLIQGNKKRNVNGAVIGVEFLREKLYYPSVIVDELKEHSDYPNFVIVDDLCDGGGTFIAIAKAIHEHAPHAKVYLVVTHAIFSKGLTIFDGHIERIYCTNSFADFEDLLVRQLKL